MSRISPVVVTLLALVSPALGQTQPAATPDPALQKAQAAFEALAEDERRKIQLDLMFATEFSGAALGTFGPLTFRALQAFERTNRSSVDGVLDATERAALAAAAKRERDKLGFRTVIDPATKAALGLPMALLPKAEPQAPGGPRWQTADGKATVTMRAPAPAEGTLEQLFEKAQVSPNPQRKVTYKLLRPDFYVVAGETPQGKFYLRMAKTPDGALRGFSISYDKSIAAVWDRATVAAANTFTPAGQATAVRATVVTAGPSAAPPPDPLAPRSFERSLTAAVVAPGRALTAAAAFKACPQPKVGAQVARLIAEDTGAGLALVAVDGLSAPAITAGVRGGEGAVVILASGPGPDGRQALLAAPGDLKGSMLAAALQPGAAGAPVFTSNGLTGIVTADPSARFQVAGVVLAARHKVADAAVVERFLQANGVTLSAGSQSAPTPPPALGALAGRHGRSIVAIACS